VTLKTGVMILKIQLCHHMNAFNYLAILLFYSIFEQINAAWVRMRDFFQKH